MSIHHTGSRGGAESAETSRAEFDLPYVRLVAPDDPVLRAVCSPVQVTTEVRALAKRMLEVCRACTNPSGIGLAAPQVGVPWRMFVTIEPLRVGVYINPVFIALRGPRKAEFETCLSLPGLRGLRTRSAQALMRSTNLAGTTCTMQANGPLEARCWQHEMDHLNGRLIIDGDVP